MAVLCSKRSVCNAHSMPTLPMLPTAGDLPGLGALQHHSVVQDEPLHLRVMMQIEYFAYCDAFSL